MKEWNAAREDQATDRVHRIGQTRGVQIFKLITKGTLEEKIDFMITKKASPHEFDSRIGRCRVYGIFEEGID